MEQPASSRELKLCRSNDFFFPFTLHRSVTTSCRRFILRLSLWTGAFLAVGISLRQTNCWRNPARSPLTGERSECELWGLVVRNSPCFKGCLVSAELLLTWDYSPDVVQGTEDLTLRYSVLRANLNVMWTVWLLFEQISAWFETKTVSC